MKDMSFLKMEATLTKRPLSSFKNMLLSFLNIEIFSKLSNNLSDVTYFFKNTNKDTIMFSYTSVYFKFFIVS